MDGTDQHLWITILSAASVRTLPAIMPSVAAAQVIGSVKDLDLKSVAGCLGPEVPLI